MNPKQIILLASMTLALCACPLSSGDDVESKIAHSDDTRLVGKRKPDTLSDLTQELAKRKADETSKVKDSVQKAQIKVFNDAAKSEKPEDLAAALHKFESADEIRKKMTNSPDILKQYADLKEKCLADEKCKQAYLPEDEKDKKEDEDANKPKEPEKPSTSNVPDETDKRKTKPMDLQEIAKHKDVITKDLPEPTKTAVNQLLGELKENPEKIENIIKTAGSASAIDKVKALNDEIVYKDKDGLYHHIYMSDNAIFISDASNKNRKIKQREVVVNQEKVKEYNVFEPDKSIKFTGTATTWGVDTVKDKNGEFEPHSLVGKLEYTVTFKGTDEVKGSGTISGMRYAGLVKDVNGGMSVANFDGVFQLSEAKFIADQSNMVGQLTNKTWKTEKGKVYWIQKNGEFLPSDVYGEYDISLYMSKDTDPDRYLIGKASVGMSTKDEDRSDILLDATGKAE